MKVIELINKNIKEIKKVGIRNWFYFVILLRRNEFHPSLQENQKMDRDTKIAEFIKTHGVACGGNWANMLMAAIKTGMPDIYKAMPDKEYQVCELYQIIADNIQ